MNHVHILEQGQVVNAHNLRDNGQAGLLFGFGEKLQALGLHALKGIGRGTGLKGSAPQKLGSAGLHPLRDAADLRLAFHRAGARDKGQASPAYALAARQGDSRILGMKLAVGLFIGLLHPAHRLHHLLGGNVLVVNCGGVANEAQHRAGSAHPGVHLHVVSGGEFFHKAVYTFLRLV